MGSVGTISDFMSWRKDIYNNYGITVDYDIDTGKSSMQNLTTNQRKLIEQELSKFAKAFPEIKNSQITLQMSSSKLNNSEWSAQYDGRISELTFIKDIFNVSKYKSNLEEKWFGGVLTTFHPKGTTNMSVLSHELGHALIHNVSRDALNISADKLATQITDNAAKILNNRHNNLAGRISHYATRSRSETVAEAVSDYVANGNKANPYSKEIVNQLKRYYKGSK